MVDSKSRGIISPATDFNVEHVISRLRKAMRGIGTDEKIIIDILTGHSNSQRQIIQKKYKTVYGRVLKDDIKAELGGHFEDICLALLTPLAEYIVDCFYFAIKGFRTDENCIIELLVSLESMKRRTLEERRQMSMSRKSKLSSEELEERKKKRKLYMKNYRAKQSKQDRAYRLQQMRQHASEIRATETKQAREARLQQVSQHAAEIRDTESEQDRAYRLQLMRQHAVEIRAKESEPDREAQYNQDLADFLTNGLNGDVKKLVSMLVTKEREFYAEADAQLAQADAQRMLKDGLYKSWKNEDFLPLVLTTRSKLQLQATITAYEKISGHSFKEAVKAEFGGSLRQSLLGLVECVENRSAFFASQLHEALNGPKTDDNTIIRILVSRSEVDLADIYEWYHMKYDVDLCEAIYADTSGDYRTILLKLLNPQK
ncbi:annexin A3 [Caerostris darwini]|uniref:Annexin A3 n=1 Tax=Caerostris darwini TaxID=1538125 RepID=A0AAV4RFA9_9ARAC|nr:annexin A3 [Caerostris darwini]